MWAGLSLLVRDEKGEVEAVFLTALSDLGALAAGSPGDLAEQTADLLESLPHTGGETLVGAMIGALGPAGVAALRARLEADQAARRRQSLVLRRAIQMLADEQGDVDGFIAALPADDLADPSTGAQIGRRLLAAGRVDDSLAALTRSAPRGPHLPGALEWEGVYLDALDAAGRGEEAQGLRWASFQARLAPGPLRAFLKRLPDFDDVEAEERAIEHALAHRSATRALEFLVGWPAPAAAAKLVLERARDLDGGAWEAIEPAVRLLETRYPLAATVLLRAMITDTLRHKRIDRYGALEALYGECESLAAGIDFWGEVESHDSFREKLERVLPTLAAISARPAAPSGRRFPRRGRPRP